MDNQLINVSVSAKKDYYKLPLTILRHNGRIGTAPIPSSLSYGKVY